MASNLINDVRYSLRGFARRPVFAAVIVATLALAIGLNVAVFSVYDQVMLRRLPVADPASLVNFVGAGPHPGFNLCGTQGVCDETFSYPMFRDLERATTSGNGPLAGIAATKLTLTALGFEQRTTPEQVLLVSGSYFSLLGIAPAEGRFIGPQDDGEPGSAAVVVLAYDYWQSTLGARRDVLGKTLTVGGKSLEIVGVAPRGFAGTTPGDRVQAFAPMSFNWFNVPGFPPLQTNRFAYWAYLFGRLAPGATLEQAQAAINVPYRAAVNDIEAPTAQDLKESELEEFRTKTIALLPGAQGQSMVSRGTHTPLAILFAATATIFLTACVNLANLMLARGAARVGEVAVRASLGASRQRLASLFAIEALLLAGIAAVASLPVALGAVAAVAAWVPGLTIRAPDLSLHWRAVVAAFVVAALAAVVFALVPMLKLAAIHPGRALQAAGAGRSFGGKGIGRFRFMLSTSQIALSMLMLVLAALFTQSLANVARVELGLRTESLVTFLVSPGLNGYPPAKAQQVFDALEQELAAQPSVTDVTTSMVPLLSGSAWGSGVVADGYDASAQARNERDTSINVVGTGFLRTLGVPLLIGRDFTAADSAAAPKVAIVNEGFVRRFGLGPNPLGKHVGTDQRRAPDVEIVGVFKDVAYNEVKESFPPQLVTPRTQSTQLGSDQMTFYVRTAQTPDALLGAIPRLVANVDPDVPVTNVRTLDMQIRENVRTDWLLMTLAGALAAVATLLAALGLYGVLSYTVAQRTREIGLRLALGAAPERVRGMVLKQVVWMVGIGVPLGLGAALVIGRLAAALLFGLAPTNPLAYGAAAVLLGGVVLAASYVPARRASRVDPVVALRAD
jgi:predicted permease